MNHQCFVVENGRWLSYYKAIARVYALQRRSVYNEL